MGIEDAGFEEINPALINPFISRLTGSLAGKTQKIYITPGSSASQIYAANDAEERFNCGYGLNDSYQDEMSKGGLKITGWDAGGEARIVELPNHRFFLATLFLPQLASSPAKPHPLILAFLRAAVKTEGG
jgi:CTP synthase (UTP-ammonia lyase)